MKIFLICSKQCYGMIGGIIAELKELGHELSYPNCFNNPGEEESHMHSVEEHRVWKQKMYRSSVEHLGKVDATLVLNLPIPNRPDRYIGGATMLEMYEAFRQDKKVFVYDDLPDCLYKDELNGLTTSIIHGDLSLIK